MKTAPKVFRFERNQLDLGRYELQRAGRRLPLSKMPMELLILLLERRGQLVTREEIVVRLWPNPDSIDIIQGINTAINRVRAVLNDDAGNPRFIETVVGKGYRFIADVEEIEIAPITTAARESVPLLNGDVQTQERLPVLPLSLPHAIVPEVFAPVVPPARRRRHWLPVAALLLVAAGLAAWWWRSRLTTPVKPLTFAQITTNDSENRVTAAAISPDGRLLAYADSDGVSLRVIQSGATQSLLSPPNMRVDRLAWFPDDLRLLLSGFQTATLKPQIWIVPITGAAPRLLRNDARNGVPSPDGEHVAFTTNKDSEIWLAGSTGEEPRQVIASRPGSSFPFVLWSSNGKRLAYQRRSDAPDHAQTSRFGEELEDSYRWDYESADIASGKLLSAVRDVRFDSACTLSDGRMLFLRWGLPGHRDSYLLREVETNSANGAFLSTPRTLTSFQGGRPFGLTASHDGTQMAAVLQGGQADVYVGTLHGPEPTLTDVRRLTLDTKADYPHAWTLDSESVIFESNREGRFHLYKQRLGDRRAETIAATAGEEVLPQLSPDGKWILYAFKPGPLPKPTDSLFRVPVGGGSPVQIDIGGPLDEFRCPLFGTSCVLRETMGHQEFVYYALDPVAGKGRELGRTSWMPHILGDWDVSPDGLTVALPYRDPVNRKIRIVPLGGKTEQLHEKEITVDAFAKLYGLTWAADGKGWYMSVQTDIGFSLLYVNLNGQSHLLRETVGGTWGVPSRDGRKLAFVDQTVDSNVWLLH